MANSEFDKISAGDADLRWQLRQLPREIEPAHRLAGRRVADVVQHIDLVPTILDLVKAPIPGGLRGRSLKPLLEGRGSMPNRLVYSEALYARTHFGWSELTAMTTASRTRMKSHRWKWFRSLRGGWVTSP